MLYEEKTLPDVKVNYSQFVPHRTETVSNYVNYNILPTDKCLWDAFRHGDEMAYINIYKSYSKMLYNYGCQFTTDTEMVRDCLHDFFLYLKKNRAGFGETTSIKMYLFKAFKRRVIDYLKKHSSEFKMNEMFACTQFSVELSSETVFINRQLKAEQLEKLNRALSSLDHKERKAIYYFYYQGLSYEQIAGMLNFAHVSSARRIMYRSLRRLRSYLA